LSGGWTTTDNGDVSTSDFNSIGNRWNVVVFGASSVGLGVWAMCLRNAPAGTQVIEHTASTTIPNNAEHSATAQCTGGGELAVGGGFTAPGGQVLLSEAGPRLASWMVDASNLSGSSLVLTADVMCLRTAGVDGADVLGATVYAPSSSLATAKASCPVGSVLVGGGWAAWDTNGHFPQSGFHAYGSYPYNYTTISWEAYAYNSSPSTTFAVQANAVCLRLS
jgi:hypothetical protein